MYVRLTCVCEVIKCGGNFFHLFTKSSVEYRSKFYINVFQMLVSKTEFMGSRLLKKAACEQRNEALVAVVVRIAFKG